MNLDNNEARQPAKHEPGPDSWTQAPREISDEEWERYVRRRKRDELRYAADLPASARAWWQFRSKLLGVPASASSAPSGHAAWDAAYRRARNTLEIRAERDTGITLALVGGYGTGKTVFATGLILGATARLRSALYATLYTANLAMQSGLRPDSEQSRQEIYDEFARPGLLVLDDCSATSESEAATAFLRSLVTDRYQAKRDTILVSNDTIDGFHRFAGEAVLNKMSHGGGLIEFNWETFRK